MSSIRTEIKNNIGIITLDSEKTLNALSLPMIEELQAVLNDWKKDEQICCIFLQGSGEKAFCAGGDVRKMYDAIVAQAQRDSKSTPEDCLNFFAEEYRLDYEIHRYPKPVVVWGHGIVMGGGIGLMYGASHRIATEKTQWAMPEIAIGLYPDVGGSWFLNQMQSAFGLYLGLTATRLNGADCLFLGLADFYVQSSAKEQLLHSLQQISKTDNAHQEVSAVLAKFAPIHAIPNSQAEDHSSAIAAFEELQSLADFHRVLTELASTSTWIAQGLKNFEKGSPSSAHVIWRQLRESRQLSLEAVFQSELNLSCQCCLHPDFAEGVRALLVDKDQKPQWQPARLNQVTAAWIDSYFEALWTRENHPLKNLGKN